VPESVKEMERIFRVARGLEKPENDRLEVYQRLVRGRFEDYLETTFPLFFSFAGDDLGPIIEEFIRNDHPSPLLMDLGKEFLEFFKGFDTPIKSKKPFLEDLLVYEWSEIEVFNALEEGEGGEFSWMGKYRLSASSRLLHFNYPVHRAEDLSEEGLISGKGNYHVLIYRDRDDEVKNAELTPFVFRFLKEISEGKSPLEALENSELEDSEREEVKPYLERFLGDLLGKGILIRTFHRS